MSPLGWFDGGNEGGVEGRYFVIINITLMREISFSTHVDNYLKSIGKSEDEKTCLMFIEVKIDINCKMRNRVLIEKLRKEEK